MKNRSGKRTIGLTAMASQEIANRWTEGVLRYLEDERGLTLRDFRFPKAFEVDDVSPPPPWTGKADGVLVCFGVVGGKQAREDTYRWLRRGGVPICSSPRRAASFTSSPWNSLSNLV